MLRTNFFLFSALLLSSFGIAQTLTVKNGGSNKTFTRDELLQSPHLQQIKIKGDPTYDSLNITYDAVPLKDLIPQEGTKEFSAISFTCRDGFSASLDSKILFHSNAEPWLAIENPNHPWPKIQSRNNETAGPFYLVWKNAVAGKVGREDWPFQITQFQVEKSLNERFAKGNPAPYFNKNAPEDAKSRAILNGYSLFLRNCFVCHQFNGEGPSTMGPDLNLPENPTEYLTNAALRKQIRDPQTLKHWPQGKMKGFNQASLPDDQLDAIVSYLSFMKDHKAKP